MNSIDSRATKNVVTDNYSNRNRWDFQIECAEKIATDVENPKFIGVCLYSAVGSGKTMTLIHALNAITKSNPTASVLFLAYAQNNLKRQTLETLSNPESPVKPSFSFGVIGQNRTVTVAIPQEFQKIATKGKYQYLVIDEAHVWTTSDSVLINIIKAFGIKKLIVATGTGSFFNRYNQWTTGKQFSMLYISGEEMIKRQIYSYLEVDLFRVSTYSDTNHMMTEAWNKARRCGDNLSKPVIVCHNVEQSRKVASFLESKGYRVALATSLDDSQDEQIGNFKNGLAEALVLVNRGILGLNIPAATSMIWLKRSNNIELLLQGMARMFRCNSDGATKSFLMPTTTEDWNESVVRINRTLSLTKLSVMQKFTGKLPKDPRKMEAA